MNFAALLGCFSGRATPSLRRNPKAHHTNQTRQESTYLSCEVVQTNEATSDEHTKEHEVTWRIWQEISAMQSLW